jgi:hypothetical protein
MDKKVTQVTYCVAMTVDEFTERGLINDGDDKGDKVFDSLNKLPGVYEVEFNGHFGPNVFITMAKKCDVPTTWDVIWEILEGTDDGTC